MTFSSMTGYDDPRLRVEAADAGAAAYFVKDDLSRLRHAINQQQRTNMDWSER